VGGGIIGAVLLAAIAVGIFGLPTRDTGVSNTADPVTSGDVTINVADTDATYAEGVAVKVIPSVVNVSIGQSGIDRFTGQSIVQTVGNGSGVIIRSDGYILTNNHVVESADEIIVTVGVEDVAATVVGTDPSSDLAVIKIDRTGLPAIEIGKSSELRVGEPVVAIGSPFGLERSVTSGIVSALGRSSLAEGTEGLSVYTSLIQTDAAINPGNSGGALCNESGQLVGVNTLIQSTSGSSAGIGFAIPIDFAIEIADELIATGRVAHPFMGVGTVTVDGSIAARFGLGVDSGALVQSITPGSPAEDAGLQRGDIILRIDDTEVTSVEDVFIAVRAHKVGETVAVRIVRDGEPLTLDITLGSDASAQ
jgi:putative serine protease PepD